MKFHFKRIIGQSLFTYEEMYTCLTLIEACLNSRPITPLSSNPDDLSPLTPGHFLIGTALTAPAESDVTEINIHRLDQWQKIQQVRQHFWKRWSREYIGRVQQVGALSGNCFPLHATRSKFILDSAERLRYVLLP
jgi:hypothetical protein